MKWSWKLVRLAGVDIYVHATLSRAVHARIADDSERQNSEIHTQGADGCRIGLDLDKTA